MRTIRVARQYGIIGLAVWLIVISQTHGQTSNYWTNAGSGKWETGANWSAGAPAGEHALNLITNANTKTVTIDAATAAVSSTLTISNLVVSGPVGSVNTLQLIETGAVPLEILNTLRLEANGALTVTNAAVQVSLPGGVTCIIDGVANCNGGTVTVSGDTQIGNEGLGQVSLTAGTWLGNRLYVGVNAGGAGTLTVSGGIVNLSSSSFLGYNPGSTGTVHVTGGTLSGAAGLVTVAEDGTAQVFISGDGTLLAGNMLVAANAGSTGTVTVEGGLLSVSSGNHIMIGGNVATATGTVWQIGGVIEADRFRVGSNGRGRMTLMGGTAYSRRGVTVGAFGASSGFLSIVGGSLQATNATQSSFVEVNQGLVIFNSGTITTHALVLTNAAGQFVFSGGLLRTSSTIASNGLDFSVGNGAILQMVGGVHYFDQTVQSGNSSAVTMSNATVTINGLTGAQLFLDGVTTLQEGTVLVATNVSAYIGAGGVSSTGSVIVAGSTVGGRNLNIGGFPGSSGTLSLQSGTVELSQSLTIGDCIAGATGDVHIDNGSLLVTNGTNTAVFDLRSGTVIIEPGGRLEVDMMVVTNACAQFTNNGGILLMNSRIVSPEFDTDGDGMPNGWEMNNGLDPLSGFGMNGATGDPDGDGASNFEEFKAGTLASNGASVLAITSITREGNDVRVTWSTAGIRTNRLQVATGVADGSYTNAFIDLSPSILLPVSGDTITNYLHIGGATNVSAFYYRVRLVP